MIVRSAVARDRTPGSTHEILLTRYALRHLQHGRRGFPARDLHPSSCGRRPYGTVNATRGIEPQPQRAVGGDRRRRAEQVLRSLDDHGGGAVQLGDEPTRYRSVYSRWLWSAAQPSVSHPRHPFHTGRRRSANAVAPSRWSCEPYSVATAGNSRAPIRRIASAKLSCWLSRSTSLIAAKTSGGPPASRGDLQHPVGQPVDRVHLVDQPPAECLRSIHPPAGEQELNLRCGAGSGGQP